MLNSRLSRLLLSLPLLAMPIGTMAMKPALAAGSAAEEAVRILTRARGADQQCKYLSSAEKSELSRYTARAEAAAVSQSSAAAAKAAAAAGMAEARSSTCSKDVETDVRETLEAAREAVAASQAETDRERKVAAKPTKRAAAMTEDDDRDEPFKMTGKGLGHYAHVVRAYYLERECRSLSRGEADRFWRGVVKLHKSAVRTNGKPAVARVMAAAERKASGSSCGKSVQARIRQVYSDISSR
jgi:hypothetical protein